MPKAAAGPRERLVSAAIEMVCERGVHASALADLLSSSRASRNSLYLHFPGGKNELVQVAVTEAGRQMSTAIAAITTSGTPRQWIDAMLTGWEQRLRESNYRLGCPIMAAALDEDAAVRQTAHAAFDEWQALISRALIRDNVPSAEAESLARFAISIIEGAIVLSRASHDTQPLDDARLHLTAMLDRHDRRVVTS